MLDIISKVGFLGAKLVPCDVPMEQNCQLAHDTSLNLDHSDSYRRLLGRLIYLTVNFCEVQKKHIEMLLCELFLLHPGQGIFFSKDSSLQLTAY